MTQKTSMVRHSAAILALPTVMAVVVPTFLATRHGAVHLGWGLPVPLNGLPVLVGLALIGGGLTLVAQTIRLFSRVGQGTLAPWDPTQRLVVVGIYRYVRNPMISGVYSLILGEAVLLGVWLILGWSLVFMAANLTYIPLIEEPGLHRRFGVDYADYAQHVPRWLPRRTAWQQGHESE